jgi:hypothetical protein
VLPLYAAYRRRALQAHAVALGTASALGVIFFALPKPPAYAAPERLAMTIACFALPAVGIPAWVALRRRAGDAWLAFRYHGASRAVSTTVAYLNDERRAARRGQLPAIVTAITFLGFDTVAAWPQFAAFSSYRDLFGPCAAGATALAVLAPYWRRKNIINSMYLKQSLRLQAKQVGFRPRTASEARQLATELRRPAVSRATATGFRAGGFEWHLDDFQKNAIVFGQPGSGKTAAVLISLLEGMLATSAASDLPASGCVLGPKGDFRSKVESLARRYGRERDIVVLSASDWERNGGTAKANSYNPLHSPDDALEISARLFTSAKLGGGLKTGDNSFFTDAARAFIRHAIEFLRAANDKEPPSLLDIRRLATERPEEGQSDSPFYVELTKAIFRHYPAFAPIPAATVDCLDFFENEWRRMPDRQKGGVISSVTQLLDEFSVEPFRSMMTGRSTISIGDAIDQGKIIVVDLPTAARPRMAALVTGLIKLEFQREILRRVDKKRPSFMLADEYHLLWSAGEGQGDAEFFGLSRQSNHANIVAAQNISSFYKRSGNKDEARNFLGNCATKIFLRNTETETNSWASQLFGERSEITVGSNENASLGHPVTRGFTSYARSTATVRVVPPEVFADLAIPLRGSRTSTFAETIVHLASREVIQRLDLAWRLNPL